MGFLSALGKIGKAVAPIAASFIPGAGPFIAPMVGAAMSRIGNGDGGGNKGIGPSTPPGATPPYFPTAQPRNDQSNPNFADMISRGKQEALQNQPWRTGRSLPMPEGQDPVMSPPIYPQYQPPAPAPSLPDAGGGGIGPSTRAVTRYGRGAIGKKKASLSV